MTRFATHTKIGILNKETDQFQYVKLCQIDKTDELKDVKTIEQEALFGLLKQALKPLGVDMTIRPIEPGDFEVRFGTVHYDLTGLGATK